MKISINKFRKGMEYVCNRICDMDSHGLKQFNNPNYTGTKINFDPILFTEK